MTHIPSSFSTSAALRQTLGALQLQLTQRQKELSTGRRADIGVALGAQTSRSFALSNARAEIDVIQTTNNVAAARLDTTQAALGDLLGAARNMRATLLASQTNGGDPTAIVAQARNALANFVSTLNSGDGGAFLFAGQNVKSPPVENYLATPPASNKTALDTAFRAAFGMSQNDTAISTISSAQMETFLSGDFQRLFAAPAWSADWSHATDEPLKSRISVSATIDASVTANDPAFRKLASAYVMVGDLGAASLNASTYHTVLQTALQTIDASIDDMTRTQARVGVMQTSIKDASDAISIQSQTLTLQLDALEGVDQIETATQVNDLMRQIETAFTLTSRISQLTLAKYL